MLIHGRSKPTTAKMSKRRTLYASGPRSSSPPVAVELPALPFAGIATTPKRTALYPAYKAQRKVVDDPERTEMFKTFDHTRDVVLPALGFKNNYLLDGFEADDIIAKLVEQNKGQRVPLAIYFHRQRLVSASRQQRLHDQCADGK